MVMKLDSSLIKARDFILAVPWLLSSQNGSVIGWLKASGHHHVSFGPWMISSQDVVSDTEYTEPQECLQSNDISNSHACH